MNQRIPQPSTQVEAGVDIHHQRRRPRVLRREPIRGIIAPQILVIIRDRRVRVRHRHRLVRRKARVNKHLCVNEPTARLPGVTAAGDSAARAVARDVPGGQLDAAGAGVVAQRGELVAETAAGARAVERRDGVVEDGARVELGEAARGVRRVEAGGGEGEEDARVEDEGGDWVVSARCVVIPLFSRDVE